MAAPTATALWDGEEVVVPARDIVPGDVILLRSGDKVSADARLFEAVNLQIEEAVLTGESLADARLSSTQRPGDGQEPDE
jgi:P-type Ca2+ transporter type 2C